MYCNNYNYVGVKFLMNILQLCFRSIFNEYITATVCFHSIFNEYITTMLSFNC